MQTDSDRRSSYMEIEGESPSTSHSSVLGAVHHVKEVYEWWHFLKDVKELLYGK